MSKTGIEYLDEVWNPVTGCTPISEGCANCWAKKCAETRLRGKFGYPADEPFRPGVVHHLKLEYPPHPKGKRVGVCFMGDLFHDDVDKGVIDEVIVSAMNYPDTEYFFLTKRPHNYGPQMVTEPNVFFGATCENQARLDERLPHLLKINGNIWLSLEPLLGPIVLPDEALKRLSWVVIGAESGPGRRPCEYEWVKSLVRQCVNSPGRAVPVFVKQGPGYTYGIECTADMPEFYTEFTKMPYLFGQQWAQYPRQEDGRWRS